MNREQGVGQIILEDAVAAVQRAVRLQVDDEIVAAKIMRRAGAGLDKAPLLFGQQQVPLPQFNGLSGQPDIFDEGLRVVDNLVGHFGCVSENSCGERELHRILTDDDFLGKDI